MAPSTYLGSYFLPPKSFRSVLEEDKEVTVLPSTKLACTLGPQSRDVATLEQLLEAGMSIARFDFSYGDAAYHQETLDNLRQAMARTRKLCATMIDTVGPEIFIINRTKQPIEIVAGQTIVLTSDQTQQASSEVLPISHATSSTIQPGASIFVGQYLFTGSETSSMYLTVLEVDGDRLVCKCENSCILEGLMLTAHFANVKNIAPILTEQDQRVISTFGVANNVDFISLAFCRTVQDVLDCRAVLDSCGLTQTHIIGKIESHEGLVNFADILAASDALILSRGNLGICLDAEKMFLCQKMVLRACNLAGKPVFVTRVVDTMTEAPRPTRAEATDVANLVLDGADGILLGSETFRGRDPVNTVKTVMAICKQAELCFDSEAFYRTVMDFEGANGPHPDMGKIEALASSAVRAAAKIDAKLLIVFTVTGRTARMVAKYKPSQPILTVIVPTITQNGLRWYWTGDYAARQSLCLRGVLPLMADPTIGSPGGAILDYAIAYARYKGLVKTGDRVVVSQCPRKSSSDIMEEAGVVKLITIGEDACGTVPGKISNAESAPTPNGGGTQNTVYMIGSHDNLPALTAAKTGSERN